MSALTTRLTAAQAAVQQLAAQIAAQASELAELSALAATYSEPAPAPAPVPEPPPPPPAPTPEPAPPAAQVLPTIRSLNPAAQIFFTDYQPDQQSYDRKDDPTIATTSRAFTIRACSITGADRPFSGASYWLLLDGKRRTELIPGPGDMRIKFTVDTADLAEGWHWLDIEASTDETAAPWPFYEQKGAAPAAQTTMPVVMGSHDVANMAKGAMIATAMVPAAFKPTILPLAPRAPLPFSEMLTRKAMVQIDLVPHRGTSDIYRTRDTNGVLNSMNQEAYYWSSLAGPKWPDLALLDGPRGAASLAMATHLQVSHAGTWFCDPWRFGLITHDGTVMTLAGIRHDAPALRPMPNTDAARKAAVRFVGDWSAIPPERWGFHELWGMAWDARTLPRTGPATINVNGVMMAPHDANPVCFLADAQGGRICRLEFDRTDFRLAVPPKITEFITGLADPWDCVFGDGILYVSERQANRIVAYSVAFDPVTGSGAATFLRVVLEGKAGMATVDPASRFVRRVATIADIRAQPCVLPEGLYLQDGQLYFGSIAMGQARRLDLATGAITIEVPDVPKYSYGGTNFFKLAVSDGLSGPRGAVGFQTWSIENQGRPRIFFGGKEWGWNSVTAGDGPGRGWDTLGYGCAVAFGNGQIVCSTSGDGVVTHVKAVPSDGPVVKAADWARMRKAYEGRGLHITHGPPGGFGYYGLPLPWGVHADVDAYLMAHGHQRPG